MALEVRPTDDPNRFHLYEEDQIIGEIVNEPDIEDGVLVDDTPYWCAEVWSQMGTGRKWTADGEDFDEVKGWAHELYDDMAAERRELRKGSRPPTISTPMGGQRRR
ncbi:hypothetical protein TUSST3_09740 [Streptomyces sp. TUS-ST3]|uniref:hypothetical protein n=1 Tax=Streptomyces sp. TUS-ST3 TaxID=3025591 RepID=UPI0024E08589|nr:hypothetical protein [Streptomyces sp. TUS-ST3]GLP64354.1 hypothetical protein TUSST3_09740 [Streptomyces sp. TUS-ST3]